MNGKNNFGRRASMEPRLIGRGKLLECLCASPHPQGKASMEPRLIGRGKAAAARLGRGLPPCFNGAATYWSRKGTLQNYAGLLGGASMEPRLIGRGKAIQIRD